MTDSAASNTRYVVLGAVGDADARDALRRDLEHLFSPALEVKVCERGQELLKLAAALSPPEVRVPLVIAGQVLPDMAGVELLSALNEKPDCRATRKVLLAAAPSAEELTRALNAGALHRTLNQPWTEAELHACCRAVLTSYFVHHAPGELARFSDLVDAGRVPRAQREADLDRRALSLQLNALKRSFLANIDLSDEEVERALGVGIDEALDDPPRRSYPAGTVLLEQDEPVDTISILVSGEVQLSRHANAREVILHTHSAGRIIGLLSLGHKQRAFYTCRALTDVIAIPLSFAQLETALEANPWLAGYFVTALIRSLSRRTKRTARLKVEVDQLNDELRGERDQLATALAQLEQAQLKLVESEKMATLGQLCAGVAHELNNPGAALQRSVDFMSEDLLALLGTMPEGGTLTGAMQTALEQAPISTRAQRQQRAELAEKLQDDALAQRLVKIGVTTEDQYRSLFGRQTGSKREHLLAALERYYQLGASLRNISSCTERITAIVSSLRSYTRTDAAPVANVDLHEGLENTLLMFGHALHEVEVVKHYGELPPIECHVGELNQVWTNVVSNALQAMGNRGRLELETDCPDPAHVRVRFVDSGPGVAPEDLKRVFELNFTTKQGQVSFGLGMGLSICRQVVDRHQGTIEMESEPGRTTVTVVLPVRQARTTPQVANHDSHNHTVC